METLRMYFKLLAFPSARGCSSAPISLVGMVSVIVLNVFSLATIGVVLSQFQSLAGWTIWEIVFLYSLWVLGHSLFSLLFWHMDELEFYMIQGTFDMFLVRPHQPFLAVRWRAKSTTPAWRDLLVGVAGMSVALGSLDIHWDAWQIGLPGGGDALAAALIEFSITLALGLHRLLDRAFGLEHQHRHAGQLCHPALPAGYVRELVPRFRHLPSAGGFHQLLPGPAAVRKNWPLRSLVLAELSFAAGGGHSIKLRRSGMEKRLKTV